MSSTNFSCEKCHYVTKNKQNYEKHLGTEKHISKNETYDYVCSCKKEFIPLKN